MFLPEIARRCPKNSIYFKHYISSIKWFLNIIILFPSTKYGNSNQIVESEDYKDFLGMLHEFDVNIEEIQNVLLDFDELFKDMDPKEAEEARNDILNKLEHHRIMLKINNLIATITKEKDGAKVVKKMQLNHGNKNQLFDLCDESDGTQRLFDLLPLLFEVNQNRVILIDEIDRSLHTKIVKKFIEVFNDKNTCSNSQLIVTSHDVNLMDLELLRQDEIFFVNRNEFGGSELSSLKNFNVRFDKKILKEYLDGAYGAIPKL